MFETALLAVTLVAGLSIVWSTLSLGISPMPSSMKARQAMMQLIDEADMEAAVEAGIKTTEGPIFELGSGWGNLLIPLAKKYPKRKIVGYELSVLPWLTSMILIKLLGLKNIQLYRQDYLQANLCSASLICCYLFPRGMIDLDRKLNTLDGKLEYLVSNNFSFSAHKPILKIELDDLFNSPVFLYKFKTSAL